MLDGAGLYLSVGHDEYWSRGMRDTVEAFIAGGGNAAFFSGNTSFWQVRLEGDDRDVDGRVQGLLQGRPADRHRPRAARSRRSGPTSIVGRPENHMTGV